MRTHSSIPCTHQGARRVGPSAPPAPAATRTPRVRGLALALLFAATLLGASGCTGPLVSTVEDAGSELASDYQLSLYDDDELIASGDDSSLFVMGRWNRDVPTAFRVSFSSFFGKETVWQLTAQEGGSVRIAIDARIDAEAFKVVLISPEGAVSTLLEGTGSREQTVDLDAGTYRIALVGHGARGSVDARLADASGVQCEWLGA